MKVGTEGKDRCQADGKLARDDPPFPLRDDQGVAHFGWKDVRRDQLMDSVAIVFPQLDRLERVGLDRKSTRLNSSH